jgi:uracil phosphoribosyltransferase
MLHILRHPLAEHILTRLRDHTTAPANFRALAHQIALLLAIEATRDLPLQRFAVNTPLEPHAGSRLAGSLAAVPVLRAGLGMLQPWIDLFPEVSVGYVGLERDHATAVARSYYCKLPPLEGKRVFCLDPMLATGGSAVQSLDLLRESGATDLSLVVIVAAPEGAAAVAEKHPGVPIYTAAIDRALDPRKYILPGLGDFGDRLYGT